jgi:hypothetical protein
MRADVYKNLRKKTFSILHRGKVIAHSDRILLVNCEFIVSQKGRKRVLKEKRRNVHAVIRGTVLAYDKNSLLKPSLRITEGLTRVSYNPYKGDCFYQVINGHPIKLAREVFIRGDSVMATIPLYK